MDVKRHNGNVLPKKPRTLSGASWFSAAMPQKPATILHPTSATRTRFQCSHPKQADLCMEKESHRITRGILCS